VIDEVGDLRMKSWGDQSAGVIRAAGRRVGVWIISWAKIDSVEGGEGKSLFPEKVWSVAEVFGADVRAACGDASIALDYIFELGCQVVVGLVGCRARLYIYSSLTVVSRKILEPYTTTNV
jgi:hypothetical protein